MALLASAILAEARSACLNDPSGAIYPDTPMLPVLNKAYRELQTKVSALGIGITKELSSPVTVAIGTVRLGDGAGLPANLLYPISLQERAFGTSDRYIDMDEMDVEPIVNPASTRLQYWAWREDEIKFPAASTNREVLIKHVQTLGSVTSLTSPILILNSQQWLAQRTAIIAALTIGANPSRAAALADDLVDLWDDLRITLVRRKQSIPVRRRRTRYRVP